MEVSTSEAAVGAAQQHESEDIETEKVVVCGDGGYVSIDDRGKQNISMSNKAQRVVSGKRSEYSPKPIAV